MTAAATAGRAARFNPDNPRHRWIKTEEHHKTCGWCSMHVENRPGARGKWYQAWDWPDKPDRAGAHNYGGGTVPACEGPTPDQPTPATPAGTPPVGDAAPPMVCAGCGDPLLAVAPTVFVGRDVSIEAKDPDGDYVAVKRGDGWLVRLYVPGEDVEPGRRRRSHWCVYRYRCSGHAGTCPQRGRLYPTGTWCAGCVPSTPVVAVMPG